MYGIGWRTHEHINRRDECCPVKKLKGGETTSHPQNLSAGVSEKVGSGTEISGKKGLELREKRGTEQNEETLASVRTITGEMVVNCLTRDYHRRRRVVG